MDYRARWYDTGAGRFVSVDPTGFGAGDPNLYRYVLNRPTDLVDPTGNNPLIGCAIGAAVGGLGGWLGASLLGRKYSLGRGLQNAAAGCAIGAGLGFLAQGMMGGEAAAVAEGAAESAAEAAEGAAEGAGEAASEGAAEGAGEGAAEGAGEGAGPSSGTPNFEDPTQPPGPDWEWRGPSDKGSWYNPNTGESLHPDLGHPDPIGPHYDYRAPDGSFYRIFPDGTIQPK
jgi:uncharacterized protein RhaS with RHS repeats